MSVTFQQDNSVSRHLISGSLKSIHANKQSLKSEDSAERKRPRSYTRKKWSGSRDKGNAQ